jgi:phage-related protein
MAQGLTTNTINTNTSGARVTGVTPGTDIYGFTDPVMFDKGASETPKPKVLKAQFGDGYEMRVADGINNTPRTWSLGFNNRTREDIDNLYRFFTVLASVDTCRLTVPDTTAVAGTGSTVDVEEAVTVVIEQFTRSMGTTLYYSMTCTAREVFES